MKEWWGSHRAAHHDARLAALVARWDAKREVVIPCRAEAAADMVAAAHAFSTAIVLTAPCMVSRTTIAMPPGRALTPPQDAQGL